MFRFLSCVVTAYQLQSNFEFRTGQEDNEVQWIGKALGGRRGMFQRIVPNLTLSDGGEPQKHEGNLLPEKLRF
jgi:hypothetical protein